MTGSKARRNERYFDRRAAIDAESAENRRLLAAGCSCGSCKFFRGLQDCMKHGASGAYTAEHDVCNDFSVRE